MADQYLDFVEVGAACLRDVAGAKWAGMTTAFVARPGQQTFPLGPSPDISIPSLAELWGELSKME